MISTSAFRFTKMFTSVKDDEMGRTFNTRGGDKKSINVLILNTCNV